MKYYIYMYNVHTLSCACATLSCACAQCVGIYECTWEYVY